MFCFFLSSAFGLPELSNADYVEQCRTAGVILPKTLSCAEGEELPVFRSTCDSTKKAVSRVRVTVENYDRLAANGECDNPALVQRDNPRVGCLPGARIAWIESKEDPTVCSLVCRRTNNATAPGHYQDISFLCHNPKNGATCFFNSKVETTQSGDKIPSPAEKGNHFWMEPQGLNVATCTHCHDRGPFLTTPNLGEFGKRLRKRMDELSTGRYVVVGDRPPFSTAIWKDRYVLKEPNRCTGCHDLGSGKWGGCGYLRDTALGQNPFMPQTACGLQQGWMPPPFHGDSAEWRKEVIRLRTCCRDFDANGKLSAKPACDWQRRN